GLYADAIPNADPDANPDCISIPNTVSGCIAISNANPDRIAIPNAIFRTNRHHFSN
ncbi:MAG: hypothetical protein GX916_06065, partial [Clostridiales bacterium]|nr:hypothetical protein [Clostridiales bacterium]